jgi:hypothetical protein
MERPGLSMRFEGLAGPQTRGPGVVGAPLHPKPGAERDFAALADQCQRLQLLVGELLLKNQELRCEVARLRAAD